MGGDIPVSRAAAPWRRSWRRKWRDGGTFRSLSPLAKLALCWIEDNADDDGRVLITYRTLALYLSGDGDRNAVTRMAAYRAVQECSDRGLVEIAQLPNPGIDLGQSQAFPGGSVITRVNYSEYQEKQAPPPPEPPPEKLVLVGQEYKGVLEVPVVPGRKPDPTFRYLIGQVCKTYEEVRGEKLDFQASYIGTLRAIRNVLKDDKELLRRWRLFLAEPKYWPVKNPFTFRKAFQHPRFAKRAEQSAPEPVLPDYLKEYLKEE